MEGNISNESELDNFRKEWLAETNHSKNNSNFTKQRSEVPLPLLRASISTNNESSVVPPIEDEMIQQQDVLEPTTSMDYYQLAVVAEQQGRLSAALTSYRKAFQLDPDADRSYHLLSLNKLNIQDSQPLPNGDFRFDRTIQLSPDYNNKDYQRSDAMVEKAIGKSSSNLVDGLSGSSGTKSGKGKGKEEENDHNHPSSTGFLLNSLLRSIASNPYVRPELTENMNIIDDTTLTATETLPITESEIEQEQVEEIVVESIIPITDPTPDEPITLSTLQEVRDTIAFIPLDPSLPLHLGSLPREVLMLILKTLLLTSVNPPPPSRTAIDTTTIPTPVQRGGRNKKPRTLKEEIQAIEMELGLDLDEQVYKREWRSDVEALERFAGSCRAARIVCLEDSLWRDLCLRTYVRPQLMDDESAGDIVRELHASDWRRFYIEHPRIRLDGVYISVVTYLRRGESQNAWYSAPHLITFYRYLRFYSSGLVISLQTVESPTTIVKKINPSLRMKGTTFGKWQLDHYDSSVQLWDLEDPAIVPKNIRKYSFTMGLKMSSTARGRMNKLEMKNLQTVRKSDGEVEEVPIRPTKAFYFSKVASYALDDME